MPYGNGHKVSIKQCGGKHGRWDAEASELQLPPGGYPARLSLVCDRGYWMEDFDLQQPQRDEEGELIAVTYRANATGRTITVFND